MVCDKDQNWVSFCEDWEFIRLRLAVKEGWLTSFIRKMPIPMKKEHLHCRMLPVKRRYPLHSCPEAILTFLISGLKSRRRRDK